jgi:hypothetical protein
MHRRCGVAVEVEGDRHGGVAEHLGDELRMHTLAEQERRRCMARVVRSHDRNARMLEKPPPKEAISRA